MITLKDLVRFSEDKAAAKRFTRRFLPLLLSCIIAFLSFGTVVFISVFRKPEEDLSFVVALLSGALFFAAFGLLVVTWRQMVGGVPISPQTRKPMEVYRLEDTIAEGKYELVYVCRQSRTFFRMVFKAQE